MVIAWRARLGRKLPDLPPEILFSDVELRVLALFAKSCGAAEKSWRRRLPAPEIVADGEKRPLRPSPLTGFAKKKRAISNG